MKMSDENLGLVRDFYRRLDALDFEAFDELCTSDFVSYFPGAGGPLSKDQRKATSQSFYDALDGATHSIEDAIAVGDTVALRLDVTATHTGELMGFAATNKPVSFSAMRFYKITDGLISEEWVNFDSAGLLKQLAGQ
jgi:predicted ester cyclase